MVSRNNSMSGVNSKGGSFENKHRKQPPPAQYLSSVSTIPIGNLPITYATKHSSSRSARKNSAYHDSAKHRHHAHHHCRHLQHFRHHGTEKCSCNSVNCRRVNKLQATANASTSKFYTIFCLQFAWDVISNGARGRGKSRLGLEIVKPFSLNLTKCSVLVKTVGFSE